MSKPSPAVKSLARDDAIVDGRQKSTYYILANSPHPILDGVVVDEHNAKNDGNIENGNTARDFVDDGDHLPCTRSYYPSYSEFVRAKRNRDADTTAEVDDADVAEEEDDRPGLGRRAEMRRTMMHHHRAQREGHDNLSEDEDMQRDYEFDDEGNAEMPTLETYVPREPCYEKANAILFVQVCQRLEYLWKVRLNKKGIMTKQKKLECLLPDALKKYLDGGSPFPYLRLILAEHDSTRPHTGLKEAKIAETWARAMGCDKGSESYKQLTGFKNSTIIKNTYSVGDLSCVVQDVMTERMPASGSKLTVGEVNEWLDVLVEIVKDKFGMAVEDDRAEKSAWRKSLERAVASRKADKKQDQYAILVEKLIDKNMSPVEHKFIVRIILQRIHVGINLREILGYMNSHAMDIHYSSNSLKELCSRLSDPEYVRLLKATVDKNAKEIMESNRQIWMTPSNLPAVLQNTISPMLSRRTSFQTFLKEIAHRHSQLDKALPAESPAKSCLAIKHPAFACEIKMDGERDLVHIKRGIVTIQTRNGTWYSPLYSPAIGPSLRAAIAGYDVDVILDGEMIAWDGIENRPIPFGSNRTVAEMNRNQRSRDGTQDIRDMGLHKNETDINVMTIAKDKAFKEMNKSSTSIDMSATTNVAPWGICSNKYWLQYVIFDILYLDGPGAKDLLSKAGNLFGKDDVIQTGSLINMDCMQRKCILYHLIKPQENVVDHIRSVIIRSDGTKMDAADYFLGNCGLEYGMTPCELDSIYLALCDKSGTTKFDSQRCGKTHEEIEIRRSLELESLYNQIVERGGQEGLIFKDLASPYYLGAKSRSLGYWWKLKPDYDASGAVADIDLLVLGGRYAEAMDRRGLLSSLVVGCLSTEHRYGGHSAKYMVVTKVNFAKETENVLKELTGFQRADESGGFRLGKWFESDEVPDFISSESYQRGFVRDEFGWKPEKKDRPNVWIRPEDSFVVTINSAEIVMSHSMQAGFTLRFPRITKVRGAGSEDPKNPDDVADWSQLHTIFIEQEENRQEEVSFGSQHQQTSRFLTAKQLLLSRKQIAAKKTRKQTNEVKQFHIPVAGASLSSVLDGYSFCVLPGSYSLENDAFSAAQAEEKCWATEAKLVKSREDVIRFIQSHGGTCQLAVHKGTDFVLGGTATDASVSNLRTLMENTDKNGTAKKEADARRLLELGGVIKWSFVYSIVSNFLMNLDDDAAGYRRHIKKDWPSLAYPRRSDFLVVSDAAKTSLQSTEDDYGLRVGEVAESLDFVRALEEVGRQRQKTIKSVDGVPWQVHALNNFDKHERWIFGGKVQKLWPYKHDDADDSMCILYPDLFADLGFEEKGDANKEALYFSESPRWKDVMESKSLGKVAATLPLAIALGAIVTPHLHSGVTHILCDLNRRCILKWSSMHPVSIYSDAKSGSRLHERLISLEEMSAPDWSGVLLVSPIWLEEKWNEETNFMPT